LGGGGVGGPTNSEKATDFWSVAFLTIRT
jgi:hypothetical protein